MSQEQKDVWRQRLKLYEQKQYDQIEAQIHPDFRATNIAMKTSAGDFSGNREAYLNWLKQFFDNCEWIKFDLIRILPSADPTMSMTEHKLSFKYDKDIDIFPAKAKGQVVVAYVVGINRIEPESKQIIESTMYGTYFWEGGAPDVPLDQN